VTFFSRLLDGGEFLRGVVEDHAEFEKLEPARRWVDSNVA
jgi:hypothetical protein